MNPAISVHNISKQYRLGLGPSKDNNLTENMRLIARNAWDKVLRLATPKRAIRQEESFWALRDVTFDINPGEVVGIIGRNGAGKSTLLKVLSHIVEPTSGYADINGRMGSLLEVGTGFHPELTGRENIYLNGAILGMKREEINRKFDEIVAFAEVEKFLDTPVKRYSSGMYVRLAFSVAAHLEPEILIVDEVLAVGDTQFQQKCTNRMKSIGREDRVVLFVSHNMPAIQNLCDRVIWLRNGRVVMDDSAEKVISTYNREVSNAGNADNDLTNHQGRTSESIPTMRRIRFCDDDNPDAKFIAMGRPVRLEVEFEAREPLDDITFGFVIKDILGTPVFGTNSQVIPFPPLSKRVKSGVVTARIPNIPLMPNTYTVDLFFGTKGQNFDTIQFAGELTVVPIDFFGTGKLPPADCGPIIWPVTWELIHDE